MRISLSFIRWNLLISLYSEPKTGFKIIEAFNHIGEADRPQSSERKKSPPQKKIKFQDRKTFSTPTLPSPNFGALPSPHRR